MDQLPRDVGLTAGDHGKLVEVLEVVAKVVEELPRQHVPCELRAQRPEALLERPLARHRVRHVPNLAPGVVERAEQPQQERPLVLHDAGEPAPEIRKSEIEGEPRGGSDQVLVDDQGLGVHQRLESPHGG
ncbi:hypothetical protein [Nocardioides immobilis]|uniref:hypothetical protein n=1 Tax=Nocardioides immobilis TaxID=2049295 RepID=UPI0015FC3206|nr:hypothetical protein [Nocardioides immobilis]